MSNYAVYFSPTGGTRTAVRFLAEEFGAYEEVDLCRSDMKGEMVFHESDVCVIGVPSYGGRVPQTALQRMEGFDGNRARAVLVVTYGNRAYEDTLLELRKFLEEKNFRITAAVAAVTEHSIMRQFASGRPDESDKKELIRFAREIKKKLEEPQESEILELPGNYPYREYHGVPLKPAASKKCTGCGVCAKQCPAGAIPRSAPNETEKDVCISCMRCIAVCPVNARKVNPLMLKAASQKMKKSCRERKENELMI